MSKYFLSRYVFDARVFVVIWIIPKNHTLDSVLGSPKPAFFKIVQNDLEPGVGTCHVANISNRHRKRATKYSSELCCWVCKLVFLIVSPSDINEDAKIVRSRRYPNRCAGELSGQLIESACRHPSGRAVDEKRRDGRVV